MPISEKQRNILAFPYTKYDALICDGAVRSGKTVFMMLAFVDDAMRRYNNQRFAICGKTVDSTVKNIIAPYLSLKWAKERYSLSWRRVDKLLIVSDGRHENVFEVFGGKDESSFMLIQGRTLAGVLLDEVVLQPKSFVEQAIARCSVAGSRFWFNCNPGAPGHWFYQEWVLKTKEKNALRIHFELEDNPAITKEVLERYHKLYSGVFYKRYIKGLWTAADGVIYPQFAADPGPFIVEDDNKPDIAHASIGVDFGGTGSAHSFTLTGFTPGYGQVVLLDELYHDNRKQGVLSPAQLEETFVDFVRRAQSKYSVRIAFCDSAEQTLIQGLKVAVAKARLPIEIKNAKKGPINDRIAFYNSLMAQGRFKVLRHCKAAIDALSSAVYDSKKPMEDVRLDDGSTNIDSLDSLEYSTEHVQKDILYLGVKT